MASLSRLFLAIILVGTIFSCDTIFWKRLDIKADDFPVYPNAQNVVRDGPNTDFGEVYKWSFTTEDTPDEVWQFYVDETSRKWGFYDTSSRKFDDYTLIVKSCPFYYVDMVDTAVDEDTYSIVVTFGKEPCR